MRCRGLVGDNVHEGALEHRKGLDPLFLVPGTQDNSLTPVAACGMEPESVLNCQKVVPEHLSIHDILSGHILIHHMKVSSTVQDAWWVKVVVGGPAQNV